MDVGGNGKVEKILNLCDIGKKSRQRMSLPAF